MALPPQFHSEYGDRWVLVKDKEGRLNQERQRLNAAGAHLVGYPYVDHQVGVSMWVHLFCQVGMFGGIKKTADVNAQKLGLILRYDVLTKCEIKLLTPNQINELGLPERPEHIAHYENK